MIYLYQTKKLIVFINFFNVRFYFISIIIIIYIHIHIHIDYSDSPSLLK